MKSFLLCYSWLGTIISAFLIDHFQYVILFYSKFHLLQDYIDYEVSEMIFEHFLCDLIRI